MPNIPNNATVVDLCTRRLMALAEYVDPTTRIWINGVEHSVAEVVAIYQRTLDAGAAVATKRAEITAAMGTREQHEERRNEADRALRPWVRHRFGATSKEAIDLGFAPPRVGVKSVEVKLRAVARAKATRAARHTMGKRQRLAIKGAIVVASGADDEESFAFLMRRRE